MNNINIDLQGVAAIVGIAVGGYFLFSNREVIKTVVTEKLNPVSEENIAHEATNAVGAAISGDNDFRLGVWLWEMLHGSDEAEKIRQQSAQNRYVDGRVVVEDSTGQPIADIKNELH